ncbi:MAG: CinA family nicotinamide mononucleotide deamidase-related protein [Vibrio sp.]
MVKVSMLSTGEEVLHGDIVDTNASWLSEQFFQQGFALHYRSTVGDQLEVLQQEIIALSQKSDVVIVNGGLGPTTDDLSALAAAKAQGVELELNEDWVETMTQYFKRVGRPMPESNLKQAMLPKGAEVIDNPVGTACGFCIRLNDALVFFTPGVPYEFKRMATEEILPRLKEAFPEVQRLECNKLYTFGQGESGLADLLDPIPLPEGFSLGYRSYMPLIEVKVFSPYQHPELERILDEIHTQIKEWTLGINQSLTTVVANALVEKDWQLSTLEQATGGQLARDFILQSQANSHFVQSMIDNQAAPISELHDALVLADEYRQDTMSDIVLANFNMEDGSTALVLISQDDHFAQQVRLKREYPLKAQQILLATVMQDMLRRYANQENPIAEYGQFERLAFVGN